MKYLTIFIDESGHGDNQKNRQPFFGCGFLEIANTENINEKLMKNHHNQVSFSKSSRKKFFANYLNKKIS